MVVSFQAVPAILAYGGQVDATLFTGFLATISTIFVIIGGEEK
jgi:hypothetical protein